MVQAGAQARPGRRRTGGGQEALIAHPPFEGIEAVAVPKVRSHGRMVFSGDIEYVLDDVNIVSKSSI